MKDIEELKLNIYNSFDKYKINESNFSECTINLEKDKKDEVDSLFDYEIPTHSWKDFNSNASKAISEWHNRRSSEFFDETDDYEDYFTSLWSHPKELLNLCILHDSYTNFLKLTDEIVRTRSTDKPRTFKFYLDNSFDEEQLYLYNSIACYIIAVIKDQAPLFKIINRDYPDFNKKQAINNLKKILEEILSRMLDNKEFGVHDFYDAIKSHYDYLNTLNHDTSNFLEKFKENNQKLLRPKDLDLMDIDCHWDESNKIVIDYLKSYDWNKQKAYSQYITLAINWGLFSKDLNEIYSPLIHNISEENYKHIRLKIETYLIITRFWIVQGEDSHAHFEYYKHIIPLFKKMIDPEDGENDYEIINGQHKSINSFKNARRKILIKILELNLDTFIDYLKGKYVFSEKPQDYLYNVFDSLSALRFDDEFSVLSSKVIKTLHLNSDLIINHDFTYDQQKKIIDLSEHDFQFSLNIFILYYLNEYKQNITFLDLIARNTSTNVKSYLDAMSMTPIEWSNYFMNGSELAYNSFSLENDVLDYNYYDEQYEVSLDSLFNIDSVEHQYVAPLFIYDENLEHYELEDKEDDLDYGHAIINDKILNFENMTLKNVDYDSLSDEYIHEKIDNYLASKTSNFNISFLIKFFVTVINHYHKENKSDSLNKALKDLLKLTNSVQLGQRQTYEISELLIKINEFDVSLDFIPLVTDPILKDKIHDLFCSKFSTKQIIKIINTKQNINPRKFIERLIVSNRKFSKEEYFIICNHASSFTRELNYMSSSRKFI